MSEMSGLRTRYALVPDTTRKSCYFNNKYSLFLLAAAVVLFVGGTAYVVTIGLQAKLLFPKASRWQTPQLWLHRATVYNNVTNYASVEINETNRYTKPRLHASEYKLVCYYMLPSAGQKQEGILQTGQLDADLCTHISAAFARIENNTLKLDDVQINALKDVVDLKKKNKNLKVLISVGGAGNDMGFPDMVVDHQNRKAFIKSLVDSVKEYHLDGVDLDWEFPNEHIGSDRRQKMHFTQLLREIRAEIDRQERHKFLLSVAVAAPIFMIDNCYDVSFMNSYVDYINLMSYDYHFYTKITPFTGINAPLYSPPGEAGYFALLNINSSANYWYQQGMDKQKIIIGLPTYGHTFRLLNPTNNGLMAPVSGYGKLGNFGFADFSEICTFLSANHINPIFDTETKSPYASKFHEWVSFDDVQSLTYKAEYIKNNNFGGAMVFSLNSDDHKGVCGGGGARDDQVFPLTRKIKKVLEDDLLLQLEMDLMRALNLAARPGHL